jgi:hypothetical protein
LQQRDGSLPCGAKIGGAARGQRHLQESPAHSIDRTITKTP